MDALKEHQQSSFHRPAARGPNAELSGVFRFSVRPWGLLTAAGSVACLVTMLGFLGRFSWVFDLFSHFRVQYVVVLSIFGVILLAGRQRIAAMTMFGFALLNSLPVLPVFVGGQHAVSPASPVIRAMLLNVNTRHGDAAKVTRVVLSEDPDILVLEEISSRWMKDLTWLETSFPHSCVQPREDNFGIGLFSKFPLAEGRIISVGSAEVPSILATIAIGETTIGLVATHPPPPGNREYSHWRNEQLELLPDFIPSHLPVILLGDLNVTPWNYHFRRFLARSGLEDSSRGFGLQTTWPGDNVLLRIPIDHCLHSSDISIVDRRIGDNVSSDHFPLIVDVVIGTRVVD